MKIPRWLRWRSDAELKEEIQAHLEMEIQANLDRGLSPEDARSAAKRQFGNVTLVKERARETDPLFRLEALLNDVRYALRGLARSPGFTMTAVLTLALAIGTNVAMFTVAYRVLLNPLPYPDAHRVIVLDFGNPAANVPSGFRSLTSRQYFHYLDRTRTLSALAVYQIDESTISGQVAPERIRISRATPSLVSVFEVPPALGRWFTDEEGLPGAPPVAVLSYGLWLERFGGNRDILGRSVRLDGIPAQIVGVMPASYAVPAPDIDAWLPLPLAPAAASNGYSFSGVARLRDGVTLTNARSELTRLTNELESDYPGNGFGFFVSTPTTLIEGTVGGVSTLLWVLLASVALVFLVASANVGNLVLVRTDVRQREVAMRRALGASRAGIARLFLTESALLVTFSAAVGLGLAWSAVRLFVFFGPTGLPRLEEVQLDAVSVAFTGALGLLAAVLFGAIPLWRRAPLARSLHERGRSNSAGRSRYRTRHLLMGSQVAVALVLLVASGLLVRSFQRLAAVDPGFDAASALTFQIGLPAQYPDRARVVAAHHAILDGLAVLPGVTAVSAVSPCLPLVEGGFCFGTTLAVSGRTVSPGTIPTPVAVRAVAGGYFEAMGVRLLGGRGVDREDVDRREAIAVVNQALVDAYFPGEDAIGQRVAFGYSSQDGPWRTIVGVVANTATTSLAERSATPKLYTPMSMAGGPDLPASGLVHLVGPDVSVMTYVVRSATPPADLVDAVRATVGMLDGDLALARLRTLEEILDGASEQMAFTMVLLAIAASVALVIGLIGVYGVVAYVVSQRRAELGVRLALGATPRDVATMVVRQGGLVTLAGVTAGLAAALAVSRLIESLLYDVSPRDPAVFATVTVGLLAVAMLASWLPAHRAARVSPVEALRAE